MIVFTTWKWGDKYHLDYVRRLYAGVKRNLKQAYRFACVSDDDRVAHIPGVEHWTIDAADGLLTLERGCFARLRMFDPKWQEMHGIESGDRIVCCDLDAIITGSLDELFDRPEPFVILQGANSSNPCPYNGSLMMLRAGALPYIWRDFTLKAAYGLPFFAFPDDQGWLAHKVKNAAGWKAGKSGVYAFQKPGWPNGEDLPEDARLVAFPGWRDPSKFQHIEWVRQHWWGNASGTDKA